MPELVVLFFAMSENQPIDHKADQGTPSAIPVFDRNAQARSQGDAFGIARNQGETNDAYRIRLSGVLRGGGRIIEAHEVYTGRRFDDPDQGPTGPMLGITGAVALEMQGIHFSYRDPESQVGDDMAAGMIAQAGEDPTETFIRNVFDLMGPAAGMDFIEGSQGRKPRG